LKIAAADASLSAEPGKTIATPPLAADTVMDDEEAIGIVFVFIASKRG
jgi:hypothetical protein